MSTKQGTRRIKETSIDHKKLTYLLHLYNITSPAVARKTPDHAKRLEPAVNFGRFGAAAKLNN